ncbi:uncharacterized protein [Amphiura filiformis]|uniref:uncharacterized protein isoform X2 n=1 Tax=Amphiura filiformis TaxID=82378 RepID=UPI003B215B86
MSICAEHMNENNTCDQYSGECPVIVDATQPHHSPQHKPNKTSSRNGVKMEGVPSADLIPTTHPPRMIVHEAISTMKIVFLSGVGIVAVFAAIGGLIFQKRKSQIVRKADSFFERKKAWGALVMTELNEVNERRRRARQAEVFNNVPESTYDNPPTPPSRRHTYLDSLMDTLDIQRSNYDGLRAPDGQDAIAQGTAQRNFTTLKSIADVKPINVPQEDESIYEVHECGAAACASATTSKARVDSIYTNESVFSVMNRSKMDNSLLTPVANAIVETSESEYDYPYTDMSDRACNYSSATEPRQNRRFGSRDRRMRKGSSDGQMYSVLVRPDIEAVSYQKQSYSHNLDTVAYASKIERTDEPVYEFQRIDSNTDLYSAHPNRVLIGNSLYDKPRGSSKRSNLDVPAPDDTYSDFIRDSSESTNQFALGYLTSVRKMPSIQVTPSDPTQFDYQPPEADHYQSYQCNSVIQRNLYRHQFQTVHNRPDKPTSISVTSSKLQRPNCLPLSKYHDYVNGKIISKPPLPQRYIPPLPSVRALREEGAASPSAASNGFPSPVSNASLSPSSSLPIPRSNGDYPSPDDLDSDNYLSLRFSERTPPMKPASNI